MRTGDVGTMAMESLPICLSSARRRRLNSSRPTAGVRATLCVGLRAASLLMDGRGTGLRLLAPRGRQLCKQQLHPHAHELHHFGKGDFVFLVLFVRIDADVRDLSEVANDLAGLVRHLARIAGGTGAQAVENALAPRAQRSGTLCERGLVV